eukprot:3631095-Pleurochrysis_carterae.AAC.1
MPMRIVNFANWRSERRNSKICSKRTLGRRARCQRAVPVPPVSSTRYPCFRHYHIFVRHRNETFPHVLLDHILAV